MAGYSFHRSNATKGRGTDSFERARRPRGGSARSYTEGVHTPVRSKDDKRQLIVLLAASVVLPPVGIAILWRMGIFKFPIRIAATCLAFLLMVLYFSWMIPEPKPEDYQPPIRKPSAVTEYAQPLTENDTNMPEDQTLN